MGGAPPRTPPKTVCFQPRLTILAAALKKYNATSKILERLLTFFASPGGKNKKTGVGLEVDCQKKSFIFNHL
jgi:hypothetical protein